MVERIPSLATYSRRNPDRIAFNRGLYKYRLKRNRAYASSEHIYIRDLLFFNKLVPFATYQTIKAKLENLRNN